ncbi:hypothetical protein HMPREF0454_02555 [Hafnia alvei ATCC 51873]|uniref:Uncharacterized protein n=1 Tax=Hafnia alvei ATCC 51873 TaxID=1002364 RepID=G9Y7N1_HAFAL|nr:hypothetical protein HMPREF0454_02555 [Hafnia alvei ATCC 51873]
MAFLCLIPYQSNHIPAKFFIPCPELLKLPLYWVTRCVRGVASAQYRF